MQSGRILALRCEALVLQKSEIDWCINRLDQTGRQEISKHLKESIKHSEYVSNPG